MAKRPSVAFGANKERNKEMVCTFPRFFLFSASQKGLLALTFVVPLTSGLFSSSAVSSLFLR